MLDTLCNMHSNVKVERRSLSNCRKWQASQLVCARTQPVLRTAARGPSNPDTWKLELATLNSASKEIVPEPPAVEPVALKLDDVERVYLVGVEVKSRRRSRTKFSVHESLEELGRLATTAGLRVVGQTFQILNEATARSYIGSGKVAEIAAAVRALAVDTVIFDDELTPGQQRNIEKALGEGVRIADRTALILDIFSQRAATREGRLQVELASAEYELPRLKKMWSHLERQSGSGNVKGMGETQKEIDKRLLRDRISALNKELEGVRAHRQSYRRRRKAADMPVVAIVGYTNAGKSTLINRICTAGVLAEDKLFATLDPTTRRMVLPMGKQILVSDTVGFIQKLPTQLVAAFRATLEEIQEADVLLHVVDASHPDAAKQSETVLKVLEEMGVSEDTPMVTAWNKLDATDDPAAIEALAEPRTNTVAVSALDGYGVDDLLVMIEAAMEESMTPFEALLPYTQSGMVNAIREAGIVRREEYEPEGIRISASANLSTIARLDQYITEFVPRERIFGWRREQVLRDLRHMEARDLELARVSLDELDLEDEGWGSDEELGDDDELHEDAPFGEMEGEDGVGAAWGRDLLIVKGPASDKHLDSPADSSVT